MSLEQNEPGRTKVYQNPLPVNFQQLFEALPEPYLVLGPDFRILAVSSAYLKVVGVARERILGRPFFEACSRDLMVFGPVVAREMRDHLEAAAVEKKPLSRMTRDFRRTFSDPEASRGQEHFWKLSSTPVLNPQREILWIVHQIAEITRPREPEKRASTEPEKRILELESANSQLVRSNKDLKRFAFLASHELREPLRMVSHFVSLLASRYQAALDAKAREYIHFALDGAKRMQLLVEQLLNQAQLKNASQSLAEVEANEAVRAATKNLQALIAQTGTIVTYDNLPRVRSDFTHLTQVFQNLIDNAIKYRRGSPPFVKITATRKEYEWIFSVEDNGIGIEPQSLDRIFLIFHRLHARTEYPGTGIGLAICREIIERHHGRIWVSSIPRQGSVFHFTLPAAA